MVCRVVVGCCGFPFARARYFQTYRSVEVQQTFYDPPSVDTLRRWREEAPEGFVFHVKAWQAVTHSRRSPTWRRIKRSLPGNLDNYGLLRPTEENRWAWRVTLETAEALGAEYIVLQTPPSLGYSPENAQRIEEFLSWAVGEARGFKVGWEPRGDWHEHPEELKRILCSARVVHIVDPFRRQPIICDWQRETYFRLHGIGGGEVNYRYRYTDQDHEKLAETIAKLIDEYGLEKVYVMFNNVYMGQDAARFREVARQKGLNVC
ncbi:DUF72 domain-containing protein [Hyperthermus butylicus]|uniref:DUF72 domain-containing protein n=1 Tax=Hyperthermus butylicus TaxID=54248 RepID=UPI00068E1907|nr:DUF72 domain-containing protein [Hyperthermus butylicus]